MTAKEFATTVALPIVLGLLPYFLEKKGVAVPSWVINLGGAITIAAGCYGLYVPLSWVIGKFASTTVPVPLGSALAIAVLCVVGTGAVAWWITGLAPPAYDYKKWLLDKNETISRRSYYNETVEIDGKTFDHCKFSNVTFVYHGLANTTFLEAQLEGTTLLKTDNQAAKGFAVLESMIRKNKNITKFVLGEMDAATGNVRVIEELQKRTDKQEESPKP